MGGGAGRAWDTQTNETERRVCVSRMDSTVSLLKLSDILQVVPDSSHCTICPCR